MKKLCSSNLFESQCFCLLQDNTSPDDQIQIQLVSVPMYGILTRSQSQQEPQELREYSSFTMEDVSTQRIRWESERFCCVGAGKHLKGKHWIRDI